jgi:glycerol uptake facilitator-like aquaporin
MEYRLPRRTGFRRQLALVRMPSGSQAQAFLWEAILTFFLLFVILAVAREPGSDLRPALEPDGSEPGS